MLSFVPQKTRVVLIGTSECPLDKKNLPSLPAVRTNVHDLRTILQNPSVVGIPEENFTVLLDVDDDSNVARQLVKAARAAQDTLIVYYAGHGCVGRNSTDLYLTTKNSTERDIDYDGLPFEKVRQAIRESSARKKILILDCCYSGRALEMMGSEASLLQAQLDVAGTYAMASAPANQGASAPKGATHTAFTGLLLRFLREGIDDKSDEITLGQLFEHIRNEARRSGLPEPQQANFQDAHEFVIALNRKGQVDAEAKIEKLTRAFQDQLKERDDRIAELSRRIDRLTEPQQNQTRDAGPPREATTVRVWENLVLLLLAFAVPGIVAWFGLPLGRLANVVNVASTLQYFVLLISFAEFLAGDIAKAKGRLILKYLFAPIKLSHVARAATIGAVLTALIRALYDYPLFPFFAV